jgi:polysaccharide pyruvyl transferase WcaK-like protein
MKRNAISILISILTALIGAAVFISGRGAGMEALSSLFHLIIFGSFALVVAFIFAASAMLRGEEPVGLTLLAFSLPPLIGVAAILFP